MPEYKKLIRQYNDAGVVLMKFEINVQESWKNPRIRQIEEMIAKPVLKSNVTGDLQVKIKHIFFIIAGLSQKNVLSTLAL